MGGSVSSGRNNDELIDNLVDGGLIKTQLVESVFRAVDRGLFYLPNFKDAAYRDLAWREGHIHISAPCIYTRVMEALELEPNLSFLNIGSGTGYFSTMVGLILGENGINHNIELHKDIIDYGKQKINDFVKTSVHFDDFDFCIPKFVNGNFLNININNDTVLYDRIYVGVGITDEQEQLIKSLIKINGVIVMPLNDNLVKIRRTTVDTYETTSLMTVSFASLITDNFETNPSINLPQLKPLSLQEICRFRIRKLIRQSIKKDFNDYYDIKRECSTFNKNRSLNGEHRCNSRINDSDDDDDDEEYIRSRIVCPLSRFERLFTPRRTQQESHDENSNGRSNIYYENQLRMMIYGQILDPSPTNNMLAYVPTNENDNESDEQNKNEQNLENESLIENDGSENVNKKCNTNKDEEATNNGDSSNSLSEEEKFEDTVELKNKSTSSKQISIPNQKIDNNKNSMSESGFSEESHNAISIALSSSNSSGQSCSLGSVVETKSNNDVEFSSSSSSSPSNDLDSRMKSTKKNSDENDVDENEKFKRNSQESENSSDSSDEEENENQNSTTKPQYQQPRYCKYERRTKEPGSCCSKNAENPTINFVRENHLRNRIMDLPLSNNLKNFLLYNRNI